MVENLACMIVQNQTRGCGVGFSIWLILVKNKKLLSLSVRLNQLHSAHTEQYFKIPISVNEQTNQLLYL